MSTQPDATPASSSTPRLSRRRWLTTAAATAGALAVGFGTARSTAAASPADAPATERSSLSAPIGAVRQMSMQGNMVTNWFGQSSQGGFFTAAMNGHYATQGLDMTVDQGGPGIAATPLVATGKYTFGMSATDNLLLARAEGIPVVMVFGTFQRNPQGLMYHNANPVGDFGALNGRKVFVNSAGNFWQVLAAKYGLDKVDLQNYNGQSALFLADDTSVSQCFVTSEPIILKSQGFDIGYLVNADSGFNPYQNAMICTEQTIKEKPDLVQAYVNAAVMGWSDYVADPLPTLNYIKSNYAKELNLETEPLTFASEKASFITGAGGYDPKLVGMLADAHFKATYDLMREVNVLKKDLDYTRAFDASFITKAHASMGM